MLLRAADAEQYPEFRAYLYNRFPTVTVSSKIKAGAEKFGGLSIDKFRAALHPGAYPIIDVIDVGSADPGTYYSCELGSVSDGRINLLSPLVAAFNEGPWYNQNYFKNSKGQDVPVIGAVLLHFLCHWGKGDPISGGGSNSSIDAGYKFEKSVYGRRAYFRITGSTLLV